MGAADIVPGVSGGTIAFISGIYQLLLDSIKQVSNQFLPLLLKGKFKAAFGSLNWSFFISLTTGIIIAVLSLSKILALALKNQPVLVWSFFLGLVIMSIWLIAKNIRQWTVLNLGLLAMTAIFAFWLVGLVPGSTPAQPLYFFLAGAIAICAMVLPGISGSFLLVVMGKYEQILTAVNNLDFFTLGIFVLGIGVGLIIFANLVSWLFKKVPDPTTAVLLGFMVGALRKIWPWKEVLLTTVDRHGEIIPLKEVNLWPNFTQTQTWLALVLFALGFCLIWLLEKRGSKNQS